MRSLKAKAKHKMAMPAPQFLKSIKPPAESLPEEYDEATPDKAANPPDFQSIFAGKERPRPGQMRHTTFGKE
jgi:hypothetical protein